MKSYTGNLVLSWINIMLTIISNQIILLSERSLLYYGSFFRIDDCTLFVLSHYPYLLYFARQRYSKIFDYSLSSTIMILNIIGLVKMRCTIIILGVKGQLVSPIFIVLLTESYMHQLNC